MKPIVFGENNRSIFLDFLSSVTKSNAPHPTQIPKAMAAHASLATSGLTLKSDAAAAAAAVRSKHRRGARVSVSPRGGVVGVVVARSMTNTLGRNNIVILRGAHQLALHQPQSTTTTTTQATTLHFQRRRRRSVTCNSGASPSVFVPAPDDSSFSSSSSSSSSSSLSQADSRKIVFLCAVAMLLASADRTIFSLASMAIAEDLSLGMNTLGWLQSAFLW